MSDPAAPPRPPRNPLALLDRIWAAYLAAVVAVCLLWGFDAPGAVALPFLVVHLALGGWIACLARWGPSWKPATARALRAATVAAGLPVVFSANGWLLPAVHPEPWEWTWIEVDRWLVGTDPTVAMQPVVIPVVAELLQWVYVSFYLLPMVLPVTMAVQRRWAEFDRVMAVVLFAFLVSYLGYYLFPTLPPYRFLDHGPPLEFVFLGDRLQHIVDTAEVNRWDCFPSGHTMLSVVSVVLAWRRSRAVFWVLLPVVTLLLWSTMALRYHFLADVLAGLALVPLTMVLARWLTGPAT